MTIFGIDYAWSHPSVSAMRSAGVKFVCRYLSHDASKNLDRAEADRLSDAGIWMVVVWETTAKRALSGKAGGADDAREAARQAKACGMPEDRPIYFAVDWDATPGQQDDINAYLDGAASVIGRDRVGLYGGYYPVKRALDAGKARWAWQTYAWSGGQWVGRAQIQQYRNGVQVGGADCDYDRAMEADYGQWRVGVTGGDDMPLSQEDIEKVAAETVKELLHARYNRRGHTVGLALETARDGIVELLTRTPDVDDDAIAAAALAGLTPEKIAAAIPEEAADQVAAALAARRSAAE
ncbi:DUF1906 domain-containing protein [Actinomadura darangshiensis]|uniref:DUF1906 domain-containing protein n=1 Tax=Actinomadura darangshiensis TaxID=705336 RepID=A0A4R5ADN0_9ACTN|nr:DUF1906 domain-containing protein [Actinomadura darangshiensis]TDD69376.1 DUF1906 domain-containing protein [Actinomadura darangshiensis]